MSAFLGVTQHSCTGYLLYSAWTFVLHFLVTDACCLSHILSLYRCPAANEVLYMLVFLPCFLCRVSIWSLSFINPLKVLGVP